MDIGKGFLWLLVSIMAAFALFILPSAYTMYSIFNLIQFFGVLLFIIYILCCLPKQSAITVREKRLTSVVFGYNGVRFIFSQPQYNFTSRYKDINKLEMVIHTVMTSKKYGAYPDIKGVTLNFTLKNDEHFTVNEYPADIQDFVYTIIGAGRAVEHFSYGFDGAGAEEMADLKEAMDNYYNFGYKPFLSPSAEILWKAVSFIFLGLLVYVLAATRDNPNLPAPPYIVFLVITFMADIILLADKLGKNIHETFIPRLNTKIYDNLLGKISPVQIILIKIITIIAVLYIFPHSFI